MAPSREDQLTVALIDALDAAGPAVTARFARRVVGVVLNEERITAQGTPKHSWVPPDHLTRGVVVGLAPTTHIARNTWSDPGWGESRPDAALFDDETLILFEVKIRSGSGGLGDAQLVNHAVSTGLEIDPNDVDLDARDLPAGFAVRTWADVGGWLHDELHRPEPAQPLRDVSDALVEAGLVAVAPSRPADEVALAPREPRPVGIALRDIADEWDIPRVRAIADERYGGEPVRAADCPAEQRRMIDAYRARGLAVPPGLVRCNALGGMPPLRILSMLYGHLAGTRKTVLSNAYPAPWPSFRARTIASGADRHVLVAMLAYAMDSAVLRGVASSRIRENVQILWSQAPDQGVGLEALHEALAPARR